MEEQERVNESLWQELKELNTKLLWSVSYKFAIILLLVLISSFLYLAYSLNQVKTDLRSVKEKLAPYSIEYQS